MLGLSSDVHKITRRSVLRTGAPLGLSIGALGIAGLIYGHYLEPRWIEIVSIELRLPRLSPAFDNFRLAHISDIHIESGTMRSHFPAIARLVSAQNPDCIVMTGDYVTHPGQWQEESLCEGFGHLKAPHGVVAVLGNHDHWGDGETQNGASLVRRSMERTGVTELHNAFCKIERGRDRLWICGVDDIKTGNADLKGGTRHLPPEGAAILLGHEPDHADEVEKMGRFDLMLSGHTHGGQLVMPILGPLSLPVGGKKYPRGLYQVGDMMLYTNRGLGTTHLPIRFCSRPEITLFTLTSV
jgi:predicted MPP superfamily phosphohydrolase